MTGLRFLHASDLHLGMGFGALPAEIRGRLTEARHAVIPRLAEAARAHGAAHVLLAGDTFDTGTPSDPVWRQALAAMAAAEDLTWWIIPGNHDSASAEPLWDQLAAHAGPGIRLLRAAAPVQMAPGAVLLPCPLPQAHPGRDLTAWMPGCATPEGSVRIGLAHGPVQGFDEDGATAAEVIPPDRPGSAGLDYLALGDWHGQMQVGPRCWYSGTPERDSFRHEGPGAALAVHLPGPGAPPRVTPVTTGQFGWSARDLTLVPGQDACAALEALLPAAGAGRRDWLVRLRARGRLGLAARAALLQTARRLAPEFCHLILEDSALATEAEPGALDEIAPSGALRQAAEALQARAVDPAREAAARRISEAALNRLYAYLSEARR